MRLRVTTLEEKNDDLIYQKQDQEELKEKLKSSQKQVREKDALIHDLQDRIETLETKCESINRELCKVYKKVDTLKV